MTANPQIAELVNKQCPVYYFVSGEAYLAHRALHQVSAQILAGEDEKTVLDEPAPG